MRFLVDFLKYEKKYIKIIDNIPIWVYNISILRERRNVMDIVRDILSITKDLAQIIVLALTARQLLKKDKENNNNQD